MKKTGGKEKKSHKVLSSEDSLKKKRDKKSLKKSTLEGGKGHKIEEGIRHKSSSHSKKVKEPKNSENEECKEKEVDMEVDSKERTKTKTSQSKGIKRHSESKHHKHSDSKRKKTEKEEKSISSEKKKIKRVEWQYGRYCPRELWIGKTAKVKFPAEKENDSPIFRVGTILNLKEDSKGFKNMFEIEFKNKKKSWVNLVENKVYIFGQILYLKYADDGTQSALIKDTYGFIGNKKSPLAIPVIELMDADYHEEGKTRRFDEDSDEKIPIQFFHTEKAKKIKQEHLHDLSYLRESEEEIMKKEWKNGEEIVYEIKKYRNIQLEWVQVNSCIEIDEDSSLRKYVGKVVRIFKEDKYS